MTVGFSGYVVVAKALRASDVVTWMNARQIDVEDSSELDGGWVSVTVSFDSMTADIDVVLRELSALTAAPTLSGYVVDSDFVLVDRDAPPPRAPVGVLGRSGARAYVGDALDETFPMPNSAIAGITSWAEQAGLRPDADAIDVLFRSEGESDGFVPAELLFWQLLAALGVSPAVRDDGSR